MEKKAYISPVTDVVTLNLESMLALSTTDNDALKKRGMDTKEQGDIDVWDE